MDPKPNSFSWKEKARGEGARRPSPFRRRAVDRFQRTRLATFARRRFSQPPRAFARTPPDSPSPLPTPRAIAQSSRAPESSRPDTCTAAPPSGCVPRPRPARDAGRRPPRCRVTARALFADRDRARAARTAASGDRLFPRARKFRAIRRTRPSFCFFSPFPDSPWGERDPVFFRLAPPTPTPSPRVLATHHALRTLHLLSSHPPRS